MVELLRLLWLLVIRIPRSAAIRVKPGIIGIWCYQHTFECLSQLLAFRARVRTISGERVTEARKHVQSTIKLFEMEIGRLKSANKEMIHIMTIQKIIPFVK